MTDNIATPLRTKNFHCPACGKSAPITYLPSESSRLYTSENHEPDKHTTKWKWQNPIWSDINPYLYTLWFCPECYFTDFEEDFKHDHSNPRNKISALKPLVLNEKEKENSVINFLGKDIDYKKMTPIMGIKTFLLAIFIQELITDIKKDNEYHHTRDWNKLGRLYLRLAWLYRENKSDNHLAKEANKFTLVDESLHELRQSINITKNKIKNCEDLVNASITDTEDQLLSKIFTAKTQTVENLEKLAVTLNATIVKIKTEIGENKDESELDKELKTLMIDLSTMWTEASFTEEKAMRQAIKFYSMTAENDTYLTPMGAFNVAEFTATLWKMMGKDREALTVLEELVRRASNQRTKITRKLNTKASMVDKLKIEEELKKMNAYIQEMSYQTKELKKEVEGKEAKH